MKHTLVRYRTRPGSAAENRRLIEVVFRELVAKSPEDVRYAVLTLADGSFLHIVETEGGSGPITGLEAFRAFQSGIRERCMEPPEPGEFSIVGNYRMLAGPDRSD